MDSRSGASPESPSLQWWPAGTSSLNGTNANRYGRLVGQVFADSHDVGLVQIERGMAWHYKAYEREQRPEDAKAYAQGKTEARFAR